MRSAESVRGAASSRAEAGMRIPEILSQECNECGIIDPSDDGSIPTQHEHEWKSILIARVCGLDLFQFETIAAISPTTRSSLMRMVAIALAVVVTGVHGQAIAQDPTKPTPELKVLEEWIGTWDETMTNKATEWAPKVETSTAVTKRVWSLGEKFIRAEGAWQPAKTEFLHMMSYDPVAKVYRSWYFD